MYQLGGRRREKAKPKCKHQNTETDNNDDEEVPNLGVDQNAQPNPNQL